MIDLSLLNAEQRLAAETLEGPLLVLAGAGSGKTRVLTYRIANLIEHGVGPYNILALTFTNKAAREMRERTESLIGAETNDMWVMTFHSACTRILRMDIDKLENGYGRSFTIYDDGDQMNVIDGILKKLGINTKDTPKRQYKDAISDAKNKGVDPEEFFGTDGIGDAMKLKVFKLYKQQLLEANALDFDDLIGMTLELFRNRGDVLEKYQNKFRYILVDEYQDTNMPQYTLVKMLSGARANICVVGDDDQSIYGWRGADIRNILEFEQDFPGARVIRLEQNYRSTGVILDAANEVIANNVGRKSKKLWTKKPGGENIVMHCADNEREEAIFIARRISEGVRNGAKYSDYAVLYRMNAQSRMIETILMSYGISYCVYGGQRFYERKEIKDITSYLRLIANPSDDVAFRRIVNVPGRGIGAVTLSKLAAVAEAKHKPLLAALLDGDVEEKKVADKLEPFAKLISDFMIRRTQMSVYELTSQLIFEIDYKGYIRSESQNESEAEMRFGNVMELLGNIKEVEQSVGEGEDALASFLENIALMADIDAMDDENGTVSLMTLHSAKGLEFNTVFIAGLEDGIFPTSRATFGGDALEEERRLMYVGITRAREKLYLLNTRSRTMFAHTSYNVPSRFLDEIPPRLTKRVDSDNNEVKAERSTFDTAAARPRFENRTPFNRGGFGSIRKPQSVQKNVVQEETVKPVTKSFSNGDRIRHAKFGEGTVIEVTGSGNAMIVTLDFDTVGTKKFAAAYAPVEKINK